MGLIRTPAAKTKPETESGGEPTVEPPCDEALEAKGREREGEMRDIAWCHLKAAHARFVDYTDEGHRHGAVSETECVMDWMDKYREMTEGGGGGGTMFQVVGGLGEDV